MIANNIDVVLINAGDYKIKKIAKEKFLVVIASTQGEEEPPQEALGLYKYLFSKKAPVLSDMKFAVFGLGDSSYKYFAKTSKDLDSRLAQLGGQRLYERVDADVDYQTQAKIWRAVLVAKLKERLIVFRPTSSVPMIVSDSINQGNPPPFALKKYPLLHI